MTIESVLSNLLREVNRLKNIVAEHDRRIVRAPLHAGASKVSTIASGAVEATRPYIHLVPESGTSDTLDNITNGSDGKVIIIANSRVGDTITINPYSVGGGNIDLGGSATPYDMADVHDSITLIYREDTAHWEKIGSTAVDGGVPALHAASHQHGGSDEVATDTPAANAIPKAGASGDLDIGWINQADILTDNITTSATNNFISDAELIKLAGIEPLADVTDQANVGAAIDTSSEQITLASGNKIALTDAGTLKWVNWNTIIAATNGLYVALTGAQNVGGAKTFQALLAAELGILFNGNISGKYSSGLDFGFYTASYLELMSNAYWNGSAYKRYVTGQSAKINLATDGTIYFVNTSTSGAADANITDYKIRGKINPPGGMELQAGGAADTETITIGGTLYANGAVISSAGSAETNLHVHTVPAGVLQTNGDEIIWEEFGAFAANGNFKTLKFYVNGTVVRSVTTAASGEAWWIRAIISRFSSTTVQVIATITLGPSSGLGTGTVIIGYAAITFSSGSSFVIGCTGQGTSSGDIASAHASAKYHPVNS